MKHIFKPGALVMCRCFFCKQEAYPLLIIKQCEMFPYMYFGDRTYLDILIKPVPVSPQGTLHPADAFTIYDG